MRTLFALLTLPHINQSHLKLLYAINSLRSFIFSFLSLILPIMLLGIFSAYPPRTAIFFTIMFFILHTIAQFIYIEAATHIVARYGFKAGFIVGLLSLIFFLYFLQTGQLVLAIISFAVATMQWWYTYHLVFIENGHLRHFGKEVGTSEALYVMISAAAPVLGAFLLKIGGNGAIYIFAAIIALVTIVLCFFFKGTAPHQEVSYREIFEEIKKRKQDFIAFVGVGSEEAVQGIAWPIVLYYIFHDVVEVALFSTVIILVTIVLEYIVGASSDKYDRTKMEKLGAWMMFVSWGGKALFQNPLFLGFFDLIHRMFSSFFYVPIKVIAYRHAWHEKEKYVAFREAGFKTGELLIMSCFLLFVALGLPLWLIFVVAALFSLFPMRVKA